MDVPFRRTSEPPDRVRSGDSPFRDQSRRESDRHDLDATDFSILSSSSTHFGTICPAIAIVTSERISSRVTPSGDPQGADAPGDIPGADPPGSPLFTIATRARSLPQNHVREVRRREIQDIEVKPAGSRTSRSRSGWLRVSSSRPRRDSLLHRGLAALELGHPNPC